MNNTNMVFSRKRLNNVKALLKLYRKILYSVNNNLCYLDDEVYVNSRKHLTDLVDPLVEFETKAEKKRFEDRINSCHKSLTLLELLDKTIIMVRDYPDKGRLYYDILSRYYFEDYGYTHDEIISVLEISRSNYYRSFDQAVECFYKLLIPVLNSEDYEVDDDLIPVNYG
jgi:hypothetical protein